MFLQSCTRPPRPCRPPNTGRVQRRPSRPVPPEPQTAPTKEPARRKTLYPTPSPQTGPSSLSLPLPPSLPPSAEPCFPPGPSPPPQTMSNESNNDTTPPQIGPTQQTPPAAEAHNPGEPASHTPWSHTADPAVSPHTGHRSPSTPGSFPPVITSVDFPLGESQRLLLHCSLPCAQPPSCSP